MKNTLGNKWAVIYRHTEDGKHVLRISQTYKTKLEALEEKRTDKLYDVMLTQDAIADRQYVAF